MTRSRQSDDELRLRLLVSLNELDGPMLVKSWSVLRMLLEEHPDEARVFLEAKRWGLSSATAWRAATGLSVDLVDLAWKRHVVETEGE